jgi:heme exporter protein B
MNFWQETWTLIYRDAVLEWRTKYAIGGIILYVLSTVVVAYSALIRLDPPVWNAVYWIMVLFAAISAVVKSFIQESSARQLYYYSLVNPAALLVAKMIYNTVLLTGLCFLTWALLGLLTGNPVKNPSLFSLIIVLGSLGLAVTFTFISAISAKTHNSATLMAVLGFPLIIPVLLTLVRLSAVALRLMQDTSIDGDMVILAGIDLMLMGVALVLFPFLWRD